jgi:hypothetical protein
MYVKSLFLREKFQSGSPLWLGKTESAHEKAATEYNCANSVLAAMTLNINKLSKFNNNYFFKLFINYSNYEKN